MKKIFYTTLIAIFFIPMIYAQDINNVDLLKQLFQEFYTSTLGLKGFKLHISGKINGSSRTNLTTFSAGKVGLLEKGSGTCYAYIPSNTYTGVFGFKLWLNYKQ